MGQIFFKQKDDCDWKTLPIAESHDIAFLCEENEPQYKPITFSLTAKIKLAPKERRYFKRIMRIQKIHERRVLRRWQEQWHKKHTL